MRLGHVTLLLAASTAAQSCKSYPTQDYNGAGGFATGTIALASMSTSTPTSTTNPASTSTPATTTTITCTSTTTTTTSIIIVATITATTISPNSSKSFGPLGPGPAMSKQSLTTSTDSKSELPQDATQSLQRLFLQGTDPTTTSTSSSISTQSSASSTVSSFIPYSTIALGSPDNPIKWLVGNPGRNSQYISGLAPNSASIQSEEALGWLQGIALYFGDGSTQLLLGDNLNNGLYTLKFYTVQQLSELANLNVGSWLPGGSFFFNVSSTYRNQLRMGRLGYPYTYADSGFAGFLSCSNATLQLLCAGFGPDEHTEISGGVFDGFSCSPTNVMPLVPM